ncbi:signal peptidase II [Caldicellulosiruptor naganoensis]|uniref:Lipoprotein signal peptidase n=1 Tax=Caldicellulosiruptor naganoensis TaxID=29324 RepID=A0ABY7BE20_9FIRM|nr:signal peptidase II [Caldicellulosiruptor naganoensis]WAM30607.1 signal peptidase II [Caldicellulosiruptor naganoensis]
MVYWIIIMLTFLADQLAKFLIEKYFPLGYSKEMLKHLLWVTYVQNTGGAFSILEGKQFIFILVSIILIISLFWLLIFKKLSNQTKLSIALILGGALGNLFDRIFRGYVVDFIDIKVIPVFNIADMCITVGVFVLALELLKEGRGELLQRKGI